MESCSFQGELLSVMEILAKAAVAEINRRVEESCAVLRLEVSHSRRDIELLKSKCEAMEAELRRSRMRARKRVFNPAAAERFSPLVKVVLNKDSQDTNWSRQMDAGEDADQRQQCADMAPANEAEHIQVKEECPEEGVWKNDGEDRLISGDEHQSYFEATQLAQPDTFEQHYQDNPANPESMTTPADNYSAFSEQQLNTNHNETELVVKHEKESSSNENTVPLDSASRFVSETADTQLWSSRLCRDADGPGISYSEQQFEPIPSMFPSQPSPHLQDGVPRTNQSVGSSHAVMVSAARLKRRSRTFGFKRPVLDEGHNDLCHMNTLDPSLVSQQSQHQSRDGPAHIRNPNEGVTAQIPTVSLCGYKVGSSSSMTRRMRTPWRPGFGEKRFSCTYCNKTFMRFSQLQEHLRSHTGEKPFSCVQCGRSFTKQCNLIRHAVVHSGEKPYKCSLCGKCFTQRSSLKSHQKTAH
ncbi:uncharacterized protein KZ484_020622 [Pholidichthys leucotaenia]